MRHLPSCISESSVMNTAPSLGRFYRSTGPLVMTQPSFHRGCCPSGDCDSTTCIGDNAHLECNNGKANMVCDNCYVTTACVGALGLSDDCSELRTLRDLRDTFMSCTTHGSRLIAEYYRVAPSVCKSISARPDANAVYKSIYENLVIPAVKLVQQGRMAAAVHLYEVRTRSLMEQVSERN